MKSSRELNLPVDFDFHDPGEARALYQEIFVDRCYARAASGLKAGDVVFDVGANIGLTTLFLHGFCPGLRFFCVEPLPLAISALRENIVRHHVDATIIEAAAAATRGSTAFSYYPANSVMSGLYSDAEADRAVAARYLRNIGVDRESIDVLLDRKFDTAESTCTLVTLSDVIEAHRIERVGLLKVDVEKSERDVLEGIGAEHWPLIERIALEVHAQDGRLDPIMQVLAAHGFEADVSQNALLEGTGIFDVFATRL
ncbi:31-O-demethyl-FK506 methyltransferase FkbM [Caballeronia catudaia]|uniref:31-O-demethyl-FK506 methyltransferase FkbM n=1 Tax=Caballeronia catudaia TaxID=1777136 RepID=A0A158A064_9BURK|nr:FkbM family methyltransferase [Caballeronia catudaia]SAK51109.1 31-O-demethyl-FK506 methyltransferase FkbM [Caballeronia catudaia]